MLRIDGRDVSFAETPDGGRQAVLDVVAVTFGAAERTRRSRDFATPAGDAGPLVARAGSGLRGRPTAMPVAHAAEHRVVAGGRLNLSSQLPPGDYTLQVVVTDTLAPRAQAVAMQWTNLEAVRAAQDPR